MVTLEDLLAILQSAGLPSSTIVSLGQIFWAAEVGDNDTLAKHCCIARNKKSSKADEKSLKISLSASCVHDRSGVSE